MHSPVAIATTQEPTTTTTTTTKSFRSAVAMAALNGWRWSCKVEFIQPSNWLYSVPNLLVIQHLVTLYLGGFDVRVVSEIE